MLGVKVLYDSVNLTIIKDKHTNHIWLYSYKQPIAYYNGSFNLANGISEKQYRHFCVFKNKIKNKEIC